ncbi:hypothetical protein H106_06727 [Trichophyton rubrum CBS 735.88]|nr:hypothetical protein H106_06727 [Trichophyton rubrum CBS 735.88]
MQNGLYKTRVSCQWYANMEPRGSKKEPKTKEINERRSGSQKKKKKKTINQTSQTRNQAKVHRNNEPPPSIWVTMQKANGNENENMGQRKSKPVTPGDDYACVCVCVSVVFMGSRG